MIRKYLSKKRRIRSIKRNPDETEVLSGLVKTPSQIYALSSAGVPMKVNQSSEGYNDGAVESVHSELSIQDMRRKDINDIWEAQQEANAKVKKYKQELQTQEGA